MTHTTPGERRAAKLAARDEAVRRLRDMVANAAPGDALYANAERFALLVADVRELLAGFDEITTLLAISKGLREHDKEREERQHAQLQAADAIQDLTLELFAGEDPT